MLELRFSDDPPQDSFMTFDGTVVENFYARSGPSGRYHAGHIGKIELTTDRGGDALLWSYSRYASRVLVAAVQEAMGRYAS